MSERSGVEIDYCPECRGVWLDRGELDKIIDKSESAATAQPARQPSSDHRRDDARYDSRSSHTEHHNNPHYKKKRKESFIGDLFDF